MDLEAIGAPAQVAGLHGHSAVVRPARLATAGGARQQQSLSERQHSIERWQSDGRRHADFLAASGCYRHEMTTQPDEGDVVELLLAPIQ
jgi:hypothetical protein